MTAIANAGPHSRGFPRKIDTEDFSDTETNVRDWQNTSGGPLDQGTTVGIKLGEFTGVELIAGDADNFRGILLEDIQDGEHGPVAVKGPVLVIATVTAGSAIKPAAAGTVVDGVVTDHNVGLALEGTGDTVALQAWVWLD